MIDLFVLDNFRNSLLNMIYRTKIDRHIDPDDNGWLFQIQVYLGEILPDQIRVELYAEGIDDEKSLLIECSCKEKITGAIHGYTYVTNIETTRPGIDFTARIIPKHTEAQVPAEASLISWQR